MPPEYVSWGWLDCANGHKVLLWRSNQFVGTQVQDQPELWARRSTRVAGPEGREKLSQRANPNPLWQGQHTVRMMGQGCDSPHYCAANKFYPESVQNEVGWNKRSQVWVRKAGEGDCLCGDTNESVWFCKNVNVCSLVSYFAQLKRITNSCRRFPSVLSVPQPKQTYADSVDLAVHLGFRVNILKALKSRCIFTTLGPNGLQSNARKLKEYNKCQVSMLWLAVRWGWVLFT